MELKFRVGGVVNKIKKLETQSRVFIFLVKIRKIDLHKWLKNQFSIFFR